MLTGIKFVFFFGSWNSFIRAAETTVNEYVTFWTFYYVLRSDVSSFVRNEFDVCVLAFDSSSDVVDTSS